MSHGESGNLSDVTTGRRGGEYNENPLVFDPLWPYNMDMYNYYIYIYIYIIYKYICTFCSDFIYVYLTLPPIIMEVGNGFLRNLFPLLFGSICH